MKLNWGAGIIIFMVLFMSFILMLVYKCSMQRIDLVSEKYYEQELLYQKQVDNKVNAADMKEKLKVDYNSVKKMVEIKYPSTIDAAKFSGEIVFFKPDDAKLDFTVIAHPDAQLSQLIPSSMLTQGWWRLKINWTSAGTEYYQEERILIN